MTMKDIWTFKYEPKTLNEMIVEENQKEILSTVIKETPNILLTGGPGIGKGTFVNILLNETGYDYIKINASDETSVDNIRNKVKSFATSLGITDMKYVYLNECLEENEKILVGTVDDYKSIPLRELPCNEKFNILSMNQETGKIENDIAEVNVNKLDEVFEIELEDGRTIKANENHPFFFKNKNCEISFKELKYFKENDKILSYKDDFNKQYSVKIKSIKSIGKRRVIDIKAFKNHSFITENMIPTHNCDALSQQGQYLLRQLLEDVHQYTRFIFAANYSSKIIDPIISRCQHIQLKNPPATDIYKMCVGILNQENVDFDKKVVFEIVKQNLPDIRKTINELQKNSVNCKLSSYTKVTNDVYENIFTLMKNKKLDDIRKTLRSSPINYTELYRFLFDKLGETKKPAEGILLIGKHLYQDSIVAIKEINFITMIADMYKRGVL